MLYLKLGCPPQSGVALQCPFAMDYTAPYWCLWSMDIYSDVSYTNRRSVVLISLPPFQGNCVLRGEWMFCTG